MNKCADEYESEHTNVQMNGKRSNEQAIDCFKTLALPFTSRASCAVLCVAMLCRAGQSTRLGGVRVEWSGESTCRLSVCGERVEHALRHRRVARPVAQTEQRVDDAELRGGEGQVVHVLPASVCGGGRA